MLYGHPCIGGRTHVQRILVPVVPCIQNISVWHFEYRHSLMCQFSKLFRRHIFGHLFHIIAGTVCAVTCDMVPHLLFRVFQHDVVCASDTSVVHHGKVLIFNQQVIAPVLEGRSVCMLLVHAVAVVILLGERKQTLVVAFVLQFVQLLRVVSGLEIGHRSIKNTFLGRAFVLLLFGNILFQLLRNLIHLLSND